MRVQIEVTKLPKSNLSTSRVKLLHQSQKDDWYVFDQVGNCTRDNDSVQFVTDTLLIFTAFQKLGQAAGLNDLGWLVLLNWNRYFGVHSEVRAFHV